MKKVLAFILVIATIISIGTFSVSAVKDDIEQLKVGESLEISFSADEEKIYKFNPEISGNYKITVTSDTKAAVEIEVYSQSASERLLDEGFVLTTDEKFYYGINLKQLMAGLDTEREEFMYMNARANRAIMLKLSDASSIARDALSGFNSLADYFVPSTVTVTVEAVELEPIKPGHRPHISHKNVFEFVPERTGNYRFTSELADGAIPNVKVCDYTGCIARSETFITASGETDLNFDVTAELQAGETYSSIVKTMLLMRRMSLSERLALRLKI